MPVQQRLSWSRDGVDWPNQQYSRLLTDQGMRWHLQSHGSGPVLLLLHGTSASTHSYAELMPLLAEHFQVLSVDLPGHAFTRTPDHYDFSMTAMADSIWSLLQTLNLQPKLAVRHSAGAAILCRMSLLHQLEQLPIIAINGALQGFAGLPGQLFGPMARVLAGSRLLPQLIARRAADPRAVARLLRSTGSEVNEPYADLYQRLFQDPVHVGSVLKMMAAWDLHQLEPKLRQLSAPLHLLVAEHDAAVKPANTSHLQAQLQRAGVQSSLTMMPGTGHLAHEEEPETVAELILQKARQHGMLA
jgi:magnesium chelatase accessory protein